MKMLQSYPGVPEDKEGQSLSSATHLNNEANMILTFLP